MGSKTDAFETDVLEHIFQNLAIANIGDGAGLPAGTAGSLYVALFTTTPTDSTAGTECAFGAYARVAVARSAGGWTVAGNNCSNTAAVTFAECTSGSETVNGFGIMTALTAGDLLYWAAVDTPRAVATGVTVEFAIGAIDVNED
jgi:hypothetical protein